MVSLMDVLPAAWQALCKATCSSDQGQHGLLQPGNIRAASQKGPQLPSLAWLSRFLTLGHQSGPRLMAAWHACMRKVMHHPEMKMYFQSASRAHPRVVQSL